MNRQKTTIYIVGTMHISSKSGNEIEKANKKIKFDEFLSEGVDDTKAYNLENFLKEPFFIVSTFFYFHFILKFFGKDTKMLRKLSKTRNIKMQLIDMNLSEVIEYGYKWYNYFIYVILFLFVFYSFNPLFNFFILNQTVRIILSFIFSEILYFGYFVIFKINKGREQTWIKNIDTNLKNKKYNKVLLVIGAFHVNRIKKSLIKMGLQVKSI